MERSECNSKDNLIKLLKNWLETNEQTIGNGENQIGAVKWIFININGNNYYINADTTREGVEVFVNNHEDNFPWKVITNNRGVFKKVTNDVNGNRIPGLYFYSSQESEREI